MKSIATRILFAAFIASSALADERIFTYSYEPSVEPKGDLEFEQHVTSRIGRNADVGQPSFHRVQIREEIEYGVTDNYQVALYFNHHYENFKDPATGQRRSDYRQTGFSLENIYMLLDPTDHRVGLALYLEPTYDGPNFELEQKIIIGQRHGDWRWALNLTHATEWENHFREKEGEVELSFGIARKLGSNWTLGIEVRDHNEIPEYRRWENTALYVGPVVCYKRSGWFGTLSVMPQLYGANYTGNPDNNTHLELEGHERINIRLIFGFGF
ncbi:MAG: hypothetical protein DVB33_02780 [Verrucomicrobia bacterium]|jgi:hypothetical protein|nr:MAG: hypothetical protein DVB33_02780 [Verrucomicrobiota bacterium]